MLRYITIIIAFFVSANIFAQVTVSGTILSSQNNSPVESATVYINGSSISSASDKDGNFKLNRVTYPCLLVVSCMSYHLKTIQIDKAPKTKLVIMLNEKVHEIGEVSVTGENLRKENLAKFKKYFFGLNKDKWANCAHIENEDVLCFSKYVDTLFRKPEKFDYMAKALGKPLKYTYWVNDNTIAEYGNIFNTSTKSPLVVSMDKMGYTVHIDIEFFRIEEKNIGYKLTSSKFWGDSYSYIIPTDSILVKNEKQIALNRREAYFNSSRHFIRSLIDNNLKENGFLIPTVTLDVKNPYVSDNYSFFNINPYIIHFPDNKIGIVGLKNRTFQILYFCTYRDEPVNPFTKSKKIQRRFFDAKNISYIKFSKDTCMLSNSSIDIVFSGAVTNKHIGGIILPDDYEPKKITQNTMKKQSIQTKEDEINKK